MNKSKNNMVQHETDDSHPLANSGKEYVILIFEAILKLFLEFESRLDLTCNSLSFSTKQNQIPLKTFYDYSHHLLTFVCLICATFMLLEGSIYDPLAFLYGP